MVKIIRNTTRLYRSPEIKTRTKKRSHAFDIIPIIPDEKKEKEPDWYDQQWEMQYLELQKFKKKYGHCDVSFADKNKKYCALAIWCGAQRKKRKYNSLKYLPERLRKLNELDFCWSIKDKLFERKFRQLKKYLDKYGHCNVPRIHDNKNPLYGLSRWVGKLRQEYRKKSKTLTTERMLKLNSIGFNWINPVKYGDAIRINDKDLLDELRRLYVICGNLPRIIDIDTYGKYSSAAYKYHFGNVAKARKAAGINPLKSNKSEVTWFDQLWETQFLKLKKFYMDFGHCNISSSNNPEYSLYEWVVAQRKHYRTKNKNLTTERIAKLNSIGFSWINPIKLGDAFRIDDKDLIEELKRLYAMRGKPPGGRYINKYGKYSRATYYKHFGNIAKACEAAGIYKLMKPDSRGGYKGNNHEYIIALKKEDGARNKFLKLRPSSRKHRNIRK